MSVSSGVFSAMIAAHSSNRTDTFEINRERAIDYLNTRDNVYVFDGYAGVRIFCAFLSGISQMTSCSGIPNIVSRSGLFVRELTTLYSW